MSNIKNQQPVDKNDLPHGEWVHYYKNGKLWYRRNYIHGMVHGLSEGYYDDGTLWYCVKWNMNRKIGYWRIINQKEYYLWVI